MRRLDPNRQYWHDRSLVLPLRRPDQLRSPLVLVLCFEDELRREVVLSLSLFNQPKRRFTLALRLLQETQRGLVLMLRFLQQIGGLGGLGLCRLAEFVRLDGVPHEDDERED